MAEEKRNLLGPYIPTGNLVQEIVQQGKLTWNLLMDARVPLLTKIIPFAALAYLISPVDVLPDIFLGLGQLDDIAIVLMGLRLFLEFSPADVVREHLRRIASQGHWSVDVPEDKGKDDVIDGQFRAE